MERCNNKYSNRSGSRMARPLRERECASGGVNASRDPRSVSPSRARSNAAPVTAAEGPPVSVNCEHCGREFRTKRGLGVHVRSSHPVEANNAVDVERVKARWAAEEVRLMARAEARATLAGDVQFMNRHLQEMFPNRTLEAVKGKRRNEAYKEMVIEFCHVIDTDNDGSRKEDSVTMNSNVVAEPLLDHDHDNECNAPGPLIPHQEDERLRIAIEELIELGSAIRSYEAQDLVNIARDSLASGVVDVHAIERWLGKIFPVPTVQPPQRRKQKQHSPQHKRENGKQRRLREFAIVQNLYRKNPKSCLARILDGDSERMRPSPVDFDAYWRPLMSTSSTADGDMAALEESYREVRRVGGGTSRSSPLLATSRGIHLEGLGEGATESNDNVVVDKSSLWDPVSMVEVERISVKTGTAPGLDGITGRKWYGVPVPIRALLFNLMLLAREASASITDTRTVFLERGTCRRGQNRQITGPLV